MKKLVFTIAGLLLLPSVALAQRSGVAEGENRRKPSPCAKTHNYGVCPDTTTPSDAATAEAERQKQAQQELERRQRELQAIVESAFDVFKPKEAPRSTVRAPEGAPSRSESEPTLRPPSYDVTVFEQKPAPNASTDPLEQLDSAFSAARHTPSPQPNRPPELVGEACLSSESRRETHTVLDVDSCSIPEILDVMFAGWKDLFAPACDTHDIGYGTFVRFSDFDATRLRIDEKFRADMNAICNERFKEFPELRSTCLSKAQDIFAGVRAFGGKNFRLAQVEAGACGSGPK